MKHQKQINFLGIGAQKSGTSWLFKNLNELPEFELVHVKEVHYFDQSNVYPSPNRILSFWRRLLTPSHVLRAIGSVIKYAIKGDFKKILFSLNWFFPFRYNDHWYLSLFKNLKGYKGEITPSYAILNESDIREMKQLIPDVKLVLMLRNPIDRAWSHYRFSKRKVNNFNFKNVSNDEVIKFIESDRQSLRSDYIRTLKNYLAVFRKEQILIGFYDTITEDPKTLISDIIKHICGDKTVIPINHLNLEKRIHESRKLDCPKEIEEYLKNKYYHQIKTLSNNYGGYFTKWYEESYNEQSHNKNRLLTPTMSLPHPPRDER